MSIGTRASADIGIFDEIRWGSHLCHLYQSNDELIDLAVPYFRKGLERNALCLWLSSEPLAQQVINALIDGIPHFDQCRKKGQFQTLPHTEWYLKDGRVNTSVALQHASNALTQAKVLGLEGVWVAGDLSWLDKGDWQILAAYEEAACNLISAAPVVGLCAYPIHTLDAVEGLDLFRVHQSVLVRREGRWEVIESLAQVRSEKALRETERSYQHLFDSTLDGSEVIDAATGRILIANQAAASIFGFASPEQMVGVNPLDYIPGEDRERVARMMAEYMFEKDLHQVMELRALRTDGREIWISAVGVRTQYEGRLAGLISIRDVTEQRKAENALGESQRDFQAVFDSVREGIAVFDLTGRLLRVNKRILEVGGYSGDELLGKSFDQLGMFGADEITKMASVFAPVLAGMDSPPLELEVETKSGEKLVLEARVSPLKKGGGSEVVGSIAVLRDITERKRTVELLQVSEQRNRLLVENASEGILVVQQGSVQFVNRKYLEIMEHLGYMVEELKGRTLEDFIHFEDRQAFRYVREGRLSSEEPDVIRQVRVVGKTGQIRWIELNEVRLTWDDKPALLVFLNDVTERKQAEDALIESEKRYRLLAENVSDVIWVTDVNLQPTYVSPSIERLLGWRADEALLNGLEDALSPSSLDMVRGLAARLVEADRDGHESLELQHPVEVELRRRDGSAVSVDTTVTVIRDLDGHPVQFLGVLRDITERKQAESQLQQSFQKMERTLEGTIQAIRAMVDTRDRYTAGHQLRVTELACAIAESMGLSSQQVQAVHVAGLLHDVGKILLPTEILTKPGRLNDIEFAMIRTHPRAGYNILKSIEFPWPVAKMVLQHHERMDGSGYPEQIRGEEILIEARILAVADVVEAMSSHRPYRPALGMDKALEEITKNSGVLYDPRVVDACVRVFREDSFSFKGEAAADLY
ncbi:MAG: PAS domain S-box protein [Dehalococcoidia bacterium]|nr:PAS domain S-box protein [Dehalococcoidia bacterium]